MTCIVEFFKFANNFFLSWSIIVAYEFPYRRVPKKFVTITCILCCKVGGKTSWGKASERKYNTLAQIGEMKEREKVYKKLVFPGVRT